jgi:hypothetical protein
MGHRRPVDTEVLARQRAQFDGVEGGPPVGGEQRVGGYF